MSWMDELAAPLRAREEQQQSLTEYRRKEEIIIPPKLTAFWEAVVKHLAGQHALWERQRAQLPVDAPQGIFTPRTNGFRYCAQNSIDAAIGDGATHLLMHKSWRPEVAGPGEPANPPLRPARSKGLGSLSKHLCTFGTLAPVSSRSEL